MSAQLRHLMVSLCRLLPAPLRQRIVLNQSLQDGDFLSKLLDVVIGRVALGLPKSARVGPKNLPALPQIDEVLLQLAPGVPISTEASKPGFAAITRPSPAA